MRIEIDAENIYRNLASPALSLEEALILEMTAGLREGEGWKDKIGYTAKKPSFYSSDGVCLQFPFHKVIPTFWKFTDNSYSGELRLYYQNLNAERCVGPGEILKELSEKLGQRLGNQWASLDSFGTGFILINGEPAIGCIAETPSSSNKYTISIGTGGAIKREFGEQDKFIEEMVLLEKAVNNVLSATTSIALEKKLIQSNPDITLRLS